MCVCVCGEGLTLVVPGQWQSGGTRAVNLLVLVACLPLSASLHCQHYDFAKRREKTPTLASLCRTLAPARPPTLRCFLFVHVRVLLLLLYILISSCRRTALAE